MNDSIMRGYGTSMALPLCMTGMPTSYASARHRPCMRQPKSQEKKKKKKRTPSQKCRYNIYLCLVCMCEFSEFTI